MEAQEEERVGLLDGEIGPDWDDTTNGSTINESQGSFTDDYSTGYPSSSDRITSNPEIVAINNNNSDAPSSSNASSATRARRSRKGPSWLPRLPSMLGAYANLTTGIVGVGILAYPWAFRQAGLALNVILTLIFGVLNVWAIHLLTVFAENQIRAKRLKHYTYEEVVQLTLGKWPYYLAVFFIICSVIGQLTAFLIVMADLGQPVLQEWVHVDGAFGDFLTSRVFVIISFATVFAFPLSLVSNIRSLSHSSLLAVGSVAIVGGVIIFRGVQALTDNGRDLVNKAIIASDDYHFILAMPLCMFALSCQLQVVPVYAELKQRHRQNFIWVLLCAVVSCGLLYIAMGMIAYIQFGPNTLGDILRNFPVSDILVDVAKIVMAVHLVLAFPVGLFPGRRCLDLLLSKMTGISPNPSLLRTACQNVLIISLTGALAILLPQVEVVFGLVGSTAAVAFTTFFPAMMLWVSPSLSAYSVYSPEVVRLRDPAAAGGGTQQYHRVSAGGFSSFKQKRNPFDKVKAILLMLAGVVMMLGSTAVSLYHIKISWNREFS